MSHERFLRARRPEHKQQRREAILSAARELATASGVRGVTLGEIAEAVGLAKSNVVRYFGTREEIFLQLTADCWREWATEAVARLKAGEDVVDVLSGTLVDRPLFGDLLSQMACNLEQNVTTSAAAAFKDTTLSIVREVTAAVARSRPDLTDDEAFELTAASTLFAGALYPAANPPPALAEVYESNPELTAMRVSFPNAMRRVLTVLIAGFPAARG
ncbi:TetR family transcriptional regulator [Amycolatopsis pigmentata]|uniref:TetR family transcriptional regulator n=1 Tax=Amycolatopsis pigmentata TaxID=450801 RepID=A0ABW5G091_9PSEU